MKRTGLIAVALAAALTVACGGGTREEANTENPNATVGTGGEIGENPEIGGNDAAPGAERRNAGDVQQFVRDITMHNTAEIELGRLAAQRGQNAEVKRYGQMMVDEHTKAGAELKSAVATHNVQMQEQMDEKHRELAQRLRGLNGREFDREYMNAMVEGHEEVKDLLEGRANDARDNAANRNAAAAADTAVNQWAAKTLPAVEKHLQQAEQLRDRLNDNNRQTQNTPSAAPAH
jgi:putative membrane protein